MSETIQNTKDTWSLRKKVGIAAGALVLVAFSPDIVTTILSEPTTPVLDTLTGK